MALKLKKDCNANEKRNEENSYRLLVDDEEYEEVNKTCKYSEKCATQEVELLMRCRRWIANKNLDRGEQNNGTSKSAQSNAETENKAERRAGSGDEGGKCRKRQRRDGGEGGSRAGGGRGGTTREDAETARWALAAAANENQA